ncbi:MAG: peptidylprolyl isomerase [Alphaproteobacteria bacterium]|nr:MAG: peptidylprolyl isomerase [Alphaproteobacteria bacterium]
MTRLKATALALALAAAPALPVAAQQDQPKPSPDTVLATVNGKPITLGHVIVLTSQLPKKYRELPDETLLNAIVEQLIQQEAVGQTYDKPNSKAVQLSVENDRRSFIYGQKLEEIRAAEIPEDEIRAAYDAFVAKMPQEEEFNASHILVETEDEAKKLIDELEAGADFATLAKEHSKGPSGPKGGALGWFTRGTMVKEFEDAVVALEPGSIGGPVKTQFGWHVIRLNDKRIKPKPTFEEMREDIANSLREQRMRAEIERLVGEAKIERPEVAIDPAAIRDLSILDE